MECGVDRVWIRAMCDERIYVQYHHSRGHLFAVAVSLFYFHRVRSGGRPDSQDPKKISCDTFVSPPPRLCSSWCSACVLLRSITNFQTHTRKPKGI